MLDNETKQRINSARQILVGKVPDPKAQVEQITTALIYKFMDDMDRENEELGGKATFFTGILKEFAWGKLMSRSNSGEQRWDLYTRALVEFSKAKHVPELFRTIFKGAFLPYRDPETLNLFLKEISGFSYGNSENLGNAFEYLLSILGSQGDAGQFRTPRHIIDFIVEVVDPGKTDKILDPACGTAGFLISAFKHIQRANSSNFKPNTFTPGFAQPVSGDVATLEIQSNGKYRGDKLSPDDRKRLTRNIVGYDISPDMVRLSLVNMYLHGFPTPEIHEYDSLTYEERWDDNFDVILANPPFMTPKGGIRPHSRFQVNANRSEVLFVDYIAEHLTINGKAGIIVPEGIIFQSSNAYKDLRKWLVEDNYLWAVASLPAGVFQPYSGVKTSILFFDKQAAKKSSEILFVKVENDGFDLGAQRRRIDKNDLPEAYRILRDGLKGKKSKSTNANWVIKSEIAATGDYNLTGDRYKEALDYSRIKWPMVKLGDVCNFINGRAFKPSDWEKQDKGGLPIIRIQNLNNNNADFNYYTGKVEDKLIVQNGDLLFSWSGSRGTSFGPHLWNRGKGILNQHIFKVVHQDNYDRSFLYYMLHKIVIEVEANLHGGVGLVHITKGNLEKIQIPLPPLEVQKEIVAELESYQRIIDGARQIVEYWKPRIKIDPDWPMVKLGDVCEINPKKSEVAKLNKATNVSFIPMEDIDTVQDIIPKKEKALDEVYKGYTYFRENDVLVAKVTPCFENGKSGIAKNLKNGIGFGSSELHVIRPSDKILPEYIYPFINLDKFIQEGKKQMTGTGGLQRVPVIYISETAIPLPPLKIQQKIVIVIEAERKSIGEVKKLIEIHELKIKDKIAEVWGE